PESLASGGARRRGLLPWALPSPSVGRHHVGISTKDEVAHLPAGYSYLKTGDFRMNLEQPPLPKLLAALPLLFVDPHLPVDHPSCKAHDEWDFGREFLFRANHGVDAMMFWGRLPLALFTG